MHPCSRSRQTASRRASGSRAKIDPVVKALAAHQIVDLELARPSLEEVFLAYCEEGGS
jgi:hypothetical protein